MDFIIGLPKLKGNNVIMVVIDRLTKNAHLCSLSHPFSACTISTRFTNIAQMLYANPKIIVSDRDPIFTEKFWTELFSCLGNELSHS
jgi:hypothetical protein